MDIITNDSWNSFMAREIDKPYFKELSKFIDEERRLNDVYPKESDVFNALKITPLNDIKCVIIGQDPYHEPGQAMGLAFSVPDGTKIPRSLSNIYKEINTEYKCGIPETGNLTSWAKQGVLLLNTSLTVRKGQPGSHSGKGWEIFTNALIEEIEEKQCSPVVYMLWGNHAKEKISLIKKNRPRLMLTTSHPSPFSANKGFMGCGDFKKCNDYLRRCSMKEIEWSNSIK